MSPEDIKSRNEALLRERGVQVNPNLPVIETVDELSPQTAEAVATRTVVLTYIIGLGYGQTGERMKRALVDFGLFDDVSDKEQELLNATKISKQDEINCAWLSECVQSLAYCLGMVELDPFQNCDDDLASEFPPSFTDPSTFIASATLRPFLDIYQQADLHYRLHWAARNHRWRLWRPRFPVKESLIAERRKPLDWVIGVEAEWDEVSLDT